MRDERELISRLKAWDEEAWQTLDACIRRDLQAFFLRRFPGREFELPLDLAQETLVRVVSGIRNFDENRGSSLRSWIFGIARHVYVDSLKRRSRLPEVDLQMDLPESVEQNAASWLDWREDLKWALAQLTERQRSIFLAFEEQGMTMAEIGESRNCSVGAVKSALFHARQNLRRLLRERDPHFAESLVRSSSNAGG